MIDSAYVERFIKETKVTDINLNDCFTNQSSLRAYYGAAAANAELHLSKLKLKFDITEANIYREVREQLLAQNGKATEKAIENQVKLDPRWGSLKLEVVNAECEASIAKQLVASLNDRRDMLIQVGADRRDEAKGQLRAMEIMKNSETARINGLSNIGIRQ